MMNPVCVQCKTGMDVKQVGVTVVEMFGNPPRPYKLWAADTRECPVCMAVVTWGDAKKPFAEHYQDGFQERLDAIPEEKRVYSYEHRLPPEPRRRYLCYNHHRQEFDKLPKARRHEAGYWTTVIGHPDEPSRCELCQEEEKHEREQ